MAIDVWVNHLNALIWSPALIYLCLGVGLYFSVRTRFAQVRHFREMIRLMFDPVRGKPRRSGRGRIARTA